MTTDVWTNWKYSDSTHRVVYRVRSDGFSESCLATNQKIIDWVNLGNTIELENQ